MQCCLTGVCAPARIWGRWVVNATPLSLLGKVQSSVHVLQGISTSCNKAKIFRSYTCTKLSHCELYIVTMCKARGIVMVQQLFGECKFLCTQKLEMHNCILTQVLTSICWHVLPAGWPKLGLALNWSSKILYPMASPIWPRGTAHKLDNYNLVGCGAS